MMELILDSSAMSRAVEAANTYTRANIPTHKLLDSTCKQLNLRPPSLTGSEHYSHALSILRSIGEHSQLSAIMIGNDDLTKAQVSGWIESAYVLSASDFLDLLESKLLRRTFLVSNHITFADIIAYYTIFHTWHQHPLPKKQKYVCTMRWARHLQTLPGLKLDPMIIPDPPSILPFQNMRPYSIKEQVKIPAAIMNLAKEEGKGPQEETKQPAKAQKQKPQKKGPPPKKEEEKTQEAADIMTYIDLRVGVVKDVRRVPNADKLYLENIDLGTETRQVVSGLVDHVPQEQFEGSLVVVICNLKKSKIKGNLSEAMVLAGNDGQKIELLKPPPESQPGDKVWATDIPSEPLKQLPEKKKYWEGVKGLLNIDQGIARYKDRPLVTEKGQVSFPTLASGTIS